MPTIFEFSAVYQTDDIHHKAWAIRVARSETLKKMLETITLGWQYSTRYEEIYGTTLVPTRTSYTFRIILDDVPLC